MQQQRHHRLRGFGQELRTAEALAPEPKAIELRNTALLITLGLYLVLNYGFMLVRIPPARGSGIPIGEIVLILSLLTIKYSAEIPRLAYAMPLTPILVWWIYGFAHAAVGFFQHGMWALRDAVHVIESLFVIVGFAFVGSPKYRTLFFHWFIVILGIGTIYNLSLPYGDAISEWSPKVMSANGVQVPIIGNYVTGYNIMVPFAAFLILFYHKTWIHLVPPIAILIYAFTAWQQRTAYGVVAAALLFLGKYRKRHLNVPILMACASIALIGGASLVGLEVRGRRGLPISFESIHDLALSSFGITDSGTSWAVHQAAEGVPLRLEWWKAIVERLMANPFNLLLGLGYGTALTDYDWTADSLVREPHNSYISILARLGITGLLVWCWLHVYLLLAWNKAYRWSRSVGLLSLQNYLLVAMVYFIAIWVTAIGEDPLEKPFNIIPYYFLWGVVLRFASAAERDRGRPGRRPNQPKRRRRHRYHTSETPIDPDSIASSSADRTQFGENRGHSFRSWTGHDHQP